MDKDSGAPETRRDFLTRVGSWTLASCAVGVVAGGIRVAVPEKSSTSSNRFVLGNLGDFHTGTLTWIRERGVFVLRGENGVGCFSSRCTHLGCTVRRSADGFVCPCHGARFDSEGWVVSGPAREALPWYALELDPEGRIWVDTEKRIEPGSLQHFQSTDSLSGVSA